MNRLVKSIRSGTFSIKNDTWAVPVDTIKDKEIPSLAIKSISIYGVMEIEFSKSMVPTNLTYFNDTSLELTPISDYEG